ncbi:spore germination protein [Alkalicella caledoniensis]|uniref:Spore germination protein n=1 Tax=Alkalicella caledoniensis TaxID=2731377 RepID=A0A7G9W741_ALKCA|nr:spore germination protein [Alkalicella caledoniensis]QNO14503.1 spore germination protein [Alkalicella caledoniensis]
MRQLIKKIFSAPTKKNGEKKQRGTPISKNLNKNYSYLKNLFQDCDDINFRRFKIANTNTTALIVYVDGLTNEDTLSNNVIRMLTTMAKKEVTENIDSSTIESRLISISKVTTVKEFDLAVEGLLAGEGLLIIDGISNAFSLETRQWEGRKVTEPTNEQIIRGPREGFTETLRFNTALIRRRIKNNDLKMKSIKVGRESKTDIVVAYLSNTAKDEVVKEVLKRVSQIDIDGVLESNYIEELIEERTISPFPQILNTERPDRAVGHLLEGKVAILVDGSPFVLIVPVTLAQFFHSPEDYYQRYGYVLVIRILRFFAFFASTSLPSLYVILTTYRYEMMPIRIVFSIAEGRRELPFTPFMEALLLELAVEFLREATIRIPSPIGQTIGIVGALIIGEAAIQANLVGPILVIFTAITMLGSFAIPNYSMSSNIRILRFPILLSVGILGGFGFVISWFILIIHICNLESFGVPFLQPLFPFKSSEQRDTIFRTPFRWMRRRPIETAGKNVRRQKGVESDNEKKR